MKRFQASVRHYHRPINPQAANSDQWLIAKNPSSRRKIWLRVLLLTIALAGISVLILALATQ